MSRALISDLVRYVVVTPARNEADNLTRLARCLTEQTIRPARWVIVDDGSTDGTLSLAEKLAGEHAWIRAMVSSGARDEPLARGRTGGRDVVAFNAGLAALDFKPDIAVKIDADVSFHPDYFDLLLAEFASDPKLGIASGLCYERENGSWRARYVTSVHVRGASRAYRWTCLEAIVPLEERLGWDGIDEIKATVRGWTTRVVPGLAFFHHRRMAERDGSFGGWRAQGEASHYMGYRPSYLVLRALHHARRDPAAVAMIVGFVVSALRRGPRCSDPAVRAYLKRYQSVRNVPLRRREALGRRS